ncbi:MAG: recombinase family protein [Candidatus Acidiferrales bacterium]
MSKRVIELIRVSTQAQAGDDRAGIPAQREINRRTAKIFDLKIVKTVEIVDVSGASVLASPEMQNLLRLIESPDIAGVVTKEFSRVIRPGKLTDLALLETFIETNTLLFLPDGPIDLASKTGRFIGTIRAAFAGLERREILDRMHDAKEAIRRAGRHAGGESSLPFGVGYSKAKGWYLKAEAELVKHAFTLFLSGITSYVEIARKLNIPRTSLRYILANPIYSGWRVYDKQRDPSSMGYVARPEGRQGYRRKIERTPENVIRVHVLDGIVTEEDFARVQHLIQLKSQKHWRGRIGVPERYTYNGFLTCGECREPLYTHTSKREFYICKTRHTRVRRKRELQHLRPCTNKYMLRDKLEPRINTLIGERLQDSRFLERILQDYQERMTASSSVATAGIDSATVLQKLDALRDKKSRIVDAFLEGVIDRIRRDEALRDVEREMCSYDQLLGLSPTPSTIQSIPNLDSVVRVIEPLADWEFLGRDHKRALLRQLCPEISVYQYKVKSLTLNLGAIPPKPQGRYMDGRSKKAASPSPALRSP